MIEACEMTEEGYPERREGCQSEGGWVRWQGARKQAGGRRGRVWNADLPPPELLGGRLSTGAVGQVRSPTGPALPPVPGSCHVSPLFSKPRFLVTP